MLHSSSKFLANLFIAASLLSPFVLQAHSDQQEKPLKIVSEGAANAVIVMAEPNNPSHRRAIEQFQQIIHRSTGCMVPIVEEAVLDSLPESKTVIHIGKTAFAVANGADASSLPVESYLLQRKGRHLFVIENSGSVPTTHREKPLSAPIRWALNRLLAEGIGVRWLWPGDLGTYVPAKTEFAIEIEKTSYQPLLQKRSFWIPLKYRQMGISDPLLLKLQDEAVDWAENHQAGSRPGARFGHAFMHWWAKYGAQYPDYFGETLPGFQQPYPRAERAKLRLADPGVIDAIETEYIAAGAPLYWNVCPNDGSFFDVSPETRAWDIPLNQSPESIWNASANLTGRYVEFWNRIYARLRKVNPDVILCTYAYSAYKTPPPEERPLTAKVAIALVPLYDDYEQWNGWAKNDAQVFLRPNWFHYGGSSPYLPLEESFNFLSHCWKNGMMGIDMDSVLGHWATQGLHYYLIARSSEDPALQKEEIINEYASAFAEAAPKIREYIDYWQKRSSEIHFGAPDGAYAQLIKEQKIGQRASSRGSRQAIPFLYPASVVAPAYQFLDEAKALTQDSQALARIAFLKAGLDELSALRDVAEKSAAVAANPTSAGVVALQESFTVLDDLRKRHTPAHVVWGEAAIRYEEQRRIWARPRN